MSTLTLCKDASGKITSAYIDDKRIEGFCSAVQTLDRNTLKATIVANFDSVDVRDEADMVEPEPTPTPDSGEDTVDPEGGTEGDGTEGDGTEGDGTEGDGTDPETT